MKMANQRNSISQNLFEIENMIEKQQQQKQNSMSTYYLCKMITIYVIKFIKLDVCMVFEKIMSDRAGFGLN